MDWKNFGKRAGVAVVAGPLILWACWHGGIPLLVLVEAIVLLGLLEFYQLAAKKGAQPNRVLGVAAGFGLCRFNECEGADGNQAKGEFRDTADPRPQCRQIQGQTMRLAVV